MEQDVFALTRGTRRWSPIPHAGTLIPHALERRLTPAALQRADVDWHLPRLYEFAHAMGATLIAANYARHVIDLNRPPQDESLYPGQDVTGLLPMDTFRKEPLYLPGGRPTPPSATSAASVSGGPTTRRCAPSSRRCARATARSCCGMRIRSAASCRASRASCPT